MNGDLKMFLIFKVTNLAQFCAFPDPYKYFLTKFLNYYKKIPVCYP